MKLIEKLMQDWRVKAVLAILAAAAVIAFLIAQIPSAEAADGQKWKDWGIAPYATSQEEACKKLPEAIDGFAMPSAVKAHFKAELGTTCEGGVETLLLPEDPLEQMWSGGAKPRVMNRVTVEEIPVAKSPEGRPYRKGSVVQAAKVFQWEYTYEGKKYVLSLPLVCFNWAWAYGAEPLPEPKLTIKPVVVPGACQNFVLTANAWSLQSLPADLRKEADGHIAAARNRDSRNAIHHPAYQADDVSRTMGSRLRSVVKMRAPVNVDLVVRYVDQQNPTRTQNIGILHVINGIGIFTFPDDPRQHVVETVWPGFVSPAMSGGERRLRLYPEEWRDWCEMNVHGMLP